MGYTKYIIKLVLFHFTLRKNVVIRIFKIVYRFHIIYGATLLVTSVLLLPECVFPYMTMGGLWTALGQQGEQSGKRPRHGVEENEDKLTPPHRQVHLHLSITAFSYQNLQKY